MDRGTFITWYDLPEDRRDEHHDWTHSVYIPRILELPGCLWAAHYASEDNVVLPGQKGRLSHTDNPGVGSGDRFILIFGGEDAHTFGNPTPNELHASFSSEDQAMLAKRIGPRMNIAVEEGKKDGPEIAKRSSDLTPGPCIQMGSFKSGEAEQDEVMAWYAQWRLPSMAILPGCIGVRKLISVAGWAKHIIMYEFVSYEARNKYFLDHEGPTPEKENWTDRVVRKLNHVPGSPNVAQRIWPKL